jgi:hypothetical protein
VKKFNQARVNGGSNYDSTIRGSLKHHESALLVFIIINKGNTVKVRGLPKAFITKPLLKDRGGQANSLGYSNSMKDNAMDNPQPSPKVINQLLRMLFND